MSCFGFGRETKSQLLCLWRWSVLLCAGCSTAQLFSSDDPQEETTQTEIREPLPSALAVGAAGGELSVGPSGALEYTLAVAVAEGPVAPELVLAHHSGAENGLLGRGFSLGGLSLVSRCPADRAQDGLIDPVDFDDNDRFCLDGQPLVASSGTYGKDGTEYRTAAESFQKVTSHCQAGVTACPTSFTVRSPDGGERRYGESSAGRIGHANGQAFVWLLESEQDALGNVATRRYAVEKGAFRPTEILYGGNQRAGTSPMHAVRFVYEARPDVRSGYRFGTLSESSHRLAEVQSWVLGQPGGDLRVRRTVLEYASAEAGAESILTRVQECTKVACLPFVQFEWAPTQGAASALTLPTFKGTLTESSQLLLGDFQPDGRPDALLVQPDPASTLRYRLTALERTAEGGFTARPGTSPQAEKLAPKRQVLGDFDGNGSAELATVTFGWSSARGRNQTSIALHALDTLTRRVAFEGDGAAESAPKEYFAADVNADGRTDIVKLVAGNSNAFDVFLSTGEGFRRTSTGAQAYQSVYDRFFVVDWDDDGVEDLLRVHNKCVSQPCSAPGALRLSMDVHRSEPNQDTLALKDNWWPPVGVRGHYTGHELVAGDYNGDGLTDLARVLYDDGPNGQMEVFLSTGAGFEVAAAPWGTAELHPREREAFFAAHCDADQRADILHVFQDSPAGRPSATCYRSTGRAFAKQSWATELGTSALWTKRKLAVADFDADGQSELLMLSESGGVITPTLVRATGLRPGGFLTAVRTKLGGDLRIEYGRLNEGSTYLPGTEVPTYPRARVMSSGWVVAAVHRDDGLGGTLTTRWSYRDALFDHQRGALGFAEVRATDLTTHLETRTLLRQDYPFQGRPRRSEVRFLGAGPAGEGTLVSSSEHRYAAHPYDGKPAASSARVWVYENQTDEVSFHLDSSYATTGQTATRTVQDEPNPANGTLATTAVTTTGPDGVERKTTTRRRYEDSPLKWILGLETSSRSEEVRPEGSTLAEQVTDRDFSTGLLLKQTSARTQGGVRLELPGTTYRYDTFGNATQTTVTAGGESRVTAQSYSADGRFLLSTRNPLGHTVRQEYDPVLGRPTAVIDANGRKTITRYGSFGEVEEVVRPDGTFVRTARAYCAEACTASPAGCDASCPPGAVYSVSNLPQAGTGSASVNYHDALGRVVRKRTQGLADKSVLADTRYDKLGRAYRTSRPYFDGERLSDTTASDWTRTEFDALGRAIRFVGRDGSTTRVLYQGYSAAERGLVVVTVNAKQEASTTVTNAFEETLRSQEPGGGEVRFVYDAAGNAVEAQGVTQGAVRFSVKQVFDALGRRVQLEDLSSGRTTYRYDAWGQLVETGRADGSRITQAYDALGRATLELRPEGRTDYTYDRVQNDGELGALHHLERRAPDGQVDYRVANFYDGQGRLREVETTYAGKRYRMGTTYDSLGRPSRLTFPSGFELSKVYDARGAEVAVVPASEPAKPFWLARQEDAFGHRTEVTLGNGVVQTMAFHPQTGGLTRIRSSTGSGSNVQLLEYAYDLLGNLEVRRDLMQQTEESFGYDAMSRVASSRLARPGQSALARTYAYDALGNLSHKDGLGTLAYLGGRPHLLAASEGGGLHSYDALGREVSGPGRTIQYNSHNLPVTLSRQGVQVSFFYGPGGVRVRQATVDAQGRTTVATQVGPYEEMTGPDGVVELRHSIEAGGQTVAVVALRGSSRVTRYLHRDHLGSLDAVTDEAGRVVERHSYDVWGKRRATSWEDAAGLSGSAVSRRGFTNHLDLDEVGLVHMGGRLFDPQLGRFLTPDPVVQFPNSLQAYSRYSYAMNNPGSHTDSTGFWVDPPGSTKPGRTIPMGGGVAPTPRGMPHPGLYPRAPVVRSTPVARGMPHPGLYNTISRNVPTQRRTVVGRNGVGSSIGPVQPWSRAEFDLLAMQVNRRLFELVTTGKMTMRDGSTRSLGDMFFESARSAIEGYSLAMMAGQTMTQMLQSAQPSVRYASTWYNATLAPKVNNLFAFQPGTYVFESTAPLPNMTIARPGRLQENKAPDWLPLEELRAQKLGWQSYPVNGPMNPALNKARFSGGWFPWVQKQDGSIWVGNDSGMKHSIVAGGEPIRCGGMYCFPQEFNRPGNWMTVLLNNDTGHYRSPAEYLPHAGTHGWEPHGFKVRIEPYHP